MLDQALGFLDHHFGDLDVAAGGLVEGRGDDLALHRALHVGDFLRPLVDQQHDQEDFRMVVGDRPGDVLQEHGLAGARRGDDQGALALALRSDDVDHPRRLVLDGRIGAVERQLGIGIERRQIVEIDAMTNRFGIVEIDLGDAGQSEIALAVLGAADLAFDGVAGAQAEAADQLRRDIDVVGTGEVIGLGRAQEAEAVVEDFDRAHAHDLGAIFGADLEDREHDVLLAQGRSALDPKLFGHGDEFGGGFLFEVFEMHLGRFLKIWL